MRPADNNNIENIIKIASVETNPELDREILNNLKNELHTCQNKKTDKWYTRSNIMNNKFTKIAAAAVILVTLSIFLTFSNGGSSIALADAIAPLLNAKNAILDIVIGQGENETIIHDTIMGQKIYRQVGGVQNAEMVIDLDTMEMMVLSAEEKTVTYLKLEGLGNIQNYLSHLQNLAQKLTDSEYFEVADLGYQLYDNIEYYVFEATAISGTQDIISIWIDPISQLPARILHQTANMKINCENIQFDIDIDESVFSLEVPEGYKEQKTAIDFSDNTEENFIEMLRISTEIFNNSIFPDDISLEYMIRFAQDKMQKTFDEQNISDEEQVDLSVKWGQGLVFIRMYKGQGQWYYNGKGVALGDANTPVFWWLPQDSDSWRVIYGDLTVDDCLEQDLPEVYNN